MANIKKKVNKGGTVWRVDYYDPDGRRGRSTQGRGDRAGAAAGDLCSQKIS